MNIFENSNAKGAFKIMLAALPEDIRYKFHGAVVRAYQEKQNSEADNLPTYKLTIADLRSVHTAYAA